MSVLFRELRGLDISKAEESLLLRHYAVRGGARRTDVDHIKFLDDIRRLGRGPSQKHSVSNRQGETIAIIKDALQNSRDGISMLAYQLKYKDANDKGYISQRDVQDGFDRAGLTKKLRSGDI